MWSNRSTSTINIVMAHVPLPHSFWLFHMRCFWWVNASYDSLKLHWFCLIRKGPPDTQMTQRIQIHILFDNQNIHSIYWRLNTNSWFYLAIGNYAGYLVCARCAGFGSLEDHVLLNVGVVERLMQLMPNDPQEDTSGRKLAPDVVVACRSMLIGVIATRKNVKCLNQFLHLGGLCLLND